MGVEEEQFHHVLEVHEHSSLIISGKENHMTPANSALPYVRRTNKRIRERFLDETRMHCICKNGSAGVYPPVNHSVGP